jgi:signal peptidase I
VPESSELVSPAEAPVAPKPSKASLFWREVRGFGMVIVAVLLFHSFIAKPFYIPSESMMPGLLTGDRLVVTKYAYGWSFVSPTIPNPAAIVRSTILRQGPEPWGITLPFSAGRVWGELPERGDVVIVTPPGGREDYIKRVIGLPGDTIELRGGRLILNGVPVKSERRPAQRIPIDPNMPCGQSADPDKADPALMEHIVTGADGVLYCELPIVRETLPSGRYYDTVELGLYPPTDNVAPLKVPAGRVFLMGDNRDRSADSRVAAELLGLGGAVPWENIGGRAEFITFSLDGTTSLNPLTWFTAFRGGRAGTSLHPQTKGK